MRHAHGVWNLQHCGWSARSKMITYHHLYIPLTLWRWDRSSFSISNLRWCNQSRRRCFKAMRSFEGVRKCSAVAFADLPAHPHECSLLARESLLKVSNVLTCVPQLFQKICYLESDVWARSHLKLGDSLLLQSILPMSSKTACTARLPFALDLPICQMQLRQLHNIPRVYLRGGRRSFFPVLCCCPFRTQFSFRYSQSLHLSNQSAFFLEIYQRRRANPRKYTLVCCVVVLLHLAYRRSKATADELYMQS